MKTNLSNYINSKVFFQLSKNKLLYPIVFFLRNLNLVEYNNKIYNKELFAIISYFEQQKPEIKDIKVLIKLIINYKSWEYFMTIKKLTRHQAYQAKFLSRFNFIISYTTCKYNVIVDIFIRWFNNSLANNYNDWQ